MHSHLVAFQLDRRLAALAGKSGWEYTRYADDLAFSGSRSLARPPFLQLVEEIVRDEGFRIHPRKTRIMRESTRQKLTGLIINNKANIPRRQFDELKAILTNCLRSDPQSQNREARPDFRSHLAGRSRLPKSGESCLAAYPSGLRLPIGPGRSRP